VTALQTTADRLKQLIPDEEQDAEPTGTETSRRIAERFVSVVPDSDDRLTAWELATRMLQIEEALAQPDRDVLGEALISVPRAGAQVARGIAGLEQAAGRIGGPLGESMLAAGQRREAMAQLVLTKFPRSIDTGVSLRRTIGDIVESGPALVAGGLLAMAVPESIPLQLLAFAGTTGAQAAGQAYLDSMRQTGDHEGALVEGAAAGLLETFVERFTFGTAVLNKIPRQYLRMASIRVATRMGTAAAGESLEEGVAAVGMEVTKALVRDEPQRIKAMLEADPAFTSDLIRQMLAGAGAGGFAGTVSGIVETAQISALRKKLAKGLGVTPKDIDELTEAMQAGLEAGLAEPEKPVEPPMATIEIAPTINERERLVVAPPEVVTAEPEAAGAVVPVFRGGTPSTQPSTDAEFGSGTYYGPRAVAEEFAANRPEGEVQEVQLNIAGFFDERNADVADPQHSAFIDSIVAATGLDRESIVRDYGGLGTLRALRKRIAEKSGETGAFPGSTMLRQLLIGAGFRGAIADFRDTIQYVEYLPAAMVAAPPSVPAAEAQPAAVAEPQIAPADPAGQIRDALKKARAAGERAGKAKEAAAEALPEAPPAVQKRVEQAEKAAAVTEFREAHKQAMEALGALRKDFLRQQQSTQAMRDDLAKLVKAAFGGTVPGNLLLRIGRARTTGTFAQALRAAKDALDKRNLKEARATLQKAVRTAQKRPGFATDMAEALRSAFESAGMVIEEGESLKRSLRRFRKHVGKLDVDEAVRLTETVTAIVEGQQRLQNIQRANFRQLVELIAPLVAEEIKTNLKALKIQPSGSEKRPQVEERALLQIMVGAAGLSTPTVLTEIMGGGRTSQTHQVIFRALHESRGAALARWFEGQAALRAIIEAHGLKLKSDELTETSTFMSGEKAIGGDTKAKIVPVTFGDVTINATPAEWGDLLANLEDPKTFDLIFGRGVPLIIDRHGASAKQFNITIEDIPRIREAAGVLAGIETPIVDYMNGPVTEDVRRYDMQRDGIDRIGATRYYPRKRRVKGQQEEDLEKMAASDLDRMTISQTDIAQERGHDTISPIVIRDIFQVFRNTTWKAAHLANMAPALRVADSTLRHPDVQAALRTRQQRRFNRQLTLLLDLIARDILGAPFNVTASEANWRTLMQNVGKGLLGLNVAVNLYQVVSLLSAREYIPVSFLTQAAGEVAFMHLMGDSEIEKRMYAASPDLQFREEQSAIGIVLEGGQAPGDFLGAKPRGEWMLAGMKHMDHRTIVAIWRASERYADSQVEQGRLQPAGRDEFVKDLAEETVQNTQPNFDPLHQSFLAMESKKSAMIRMASFFRSQTGMFMATTIRDVYRVRRAIRDQKNVGREVRRATANFSVNWMLNSILIQAIADFVGFAFRGFHRDDKDDTLLTFLRRSASNMLGIIPMAQFLSASFQNVFPVLSVMTAIRDDIMGIGGKHPIRRILEAAAGVSTMFGLPGVPVLRQLEQFYDAMIAEDERELNAPPRSH